MNAWLQPRELAVKGQHRKAWHRTDTQAFWTQEKGLKLFPLEERSQSTTNPAVLGSSTSCGNHSPWRKNPFIFNGERALCIRRLKSTEYFCSIHLFIQLSRNGSSLPFTISCRTRGPHHPHSWTAICFGLPSSQTLSPASFSKEPEWHARNNALPREHIWSPLSTVPVFVVQLRARYYFTSDLVRLGGNRWGKKKKKKSKSLGLQVKNDTKNFSAQPSFVNINIFHSPVDSQTTYYGSRGRLGRR